MKFGNGCWLQKEGYECFPPQQIYFTKIEPKKVTLCAPTSRISHRGDTLGGINLTLEITSPMPEVLRVKTYHHLGIRKTGPDFELETQENVELEIEDSDEKICIKSGSLSLTITKENFSMEYARDGEVISKCNGRDLAFMKTDWKGYAYDKGSKDAYMRQQLSLSVGELVYGMGERFTPFVKNGQTVDIWNEDGGTSTYQSYKNIPFYLTNKGYGIFVNNPGDVSFEVATEQVSKVQFSVSGECLDYFFINGPTMKEVLAHYTGITGKPSLPAQWTFGLWLSTSFTTNYDEETVMSFINGMEERGIPLQVFHFDCFWMKDFHWCDFTWDNRVFPDPEGMLQRIKAKGLKICVWINPYIAQESPLFLEGMEKGYFIKRTNGDVWQWDMWQPGMAIVDFTNPQACQWFKDKLAVLVDMGVDCFKTDFGERIPTEDVVYYDGADPVKMHNYYTYLYNKVVYELLEEKKGKEEAVLFARSASVGGQKFPVHWGGNTLTAPIFREDGIANYYLPAGTWTNYLTGETREGGVWVEEHHDYLSIPLWVRENSIIPVCNQMERNDDAYDKNLQLKIYELKEEASTCVAQNGSQVLSIEIKKDGEAITCKAETENAYEIRFVNCKLTSADNAELVVDGNDTIVKVSDPKAVVVCR